MSSATRQVAYTGTTAVGVDGAAASTAGTSRTVLLSASTDIYVGGFANTSAPTNLDTTGFKLATGTTLSLVLNPGERLWIRRVSADGTAYVLDNQWA